MPNKNSAGVASAAKTGQKRIALPPVTYPEWPNEELTYKRRRMEVDTILAKQMMHDLTRADNQELIMKLIKNREWKKARFIMRYAIDYKALVPLFCKHSGGKTTDALYQLGRDYLEDPNPKKDRIEHIVGLLLQHSPHQSIIWCLELFTEAMNRKLISEKQGIAIGNAAFNLPLLTLLYKLDELLTNDGADTQDTVKNEAMEEPYKPTDIGRRNNYNTLMQLIKAKNWEKVSTLMRHAADYQQLVPVLIKHGPKNGVRALLMIGDYFLEATESKQDRIEHVVTLLLLQPPREMLILSQTFLVEVLEKKLIDKSLARKLCNVILALPLLSFFQALDLFQQFKLRRNWETAHLLEELSET